MYSFHLVRCHVLVSTSSQEKALKPFIGLLYLLKELFKNKYRIKLINFNRLFCVSNERVLGLNMLFDHLGSVH